MLMVSAGDNRSADQFVRPETLERFGGARKYAEAINGSLTRLGAYASIRRCPMAVGIWPPGFSAKRTHWDNPLHRATFTSSTRR